MPRAEEDARAREEAEPFGSREGGEVDEVDFGLVRERPERADERLVRAVGQARRGILGGARVCVCVRKKERRRARGRGQELGENDFDMCCEKMQ